MNFKYQLVCLGCFVTTLASAALDPMSLAQLDVQQVLYTEQYQSIELGGEARFVKVDQNTQPYSKGVAVLLGEAGHSIASNDTLANLASQLNKVGWVTMRLPVPSFDNHRQTADIATSTETEGEQARNELARPIKHSRDMLATLSGPALLAHEQQIIEQMRAITTLAREYSGFFLVIAQGTSAASLVKVYGEQALETPDALVAISPFWPMREQNLQLAMFMAATPMAVLDLYHVQDNAWSIQGSTERLIAANKAQKLHYRQRQLIGIGDAGQRGRYVAKEVYGWLNKLGW